MYTDQELTPAHIVRFLGLYDLNCDQVAVDLKTKQLYTTPQFDQFLATRRLVITNLQNPCSTLGRVFKKTHRFNLSEDQLPEILAPLNELFSLTLLPSTHPNATALKEVVVDLVADPVLLSRYPKATEYYGRHTSSLAGEDVVLAPLRPADTTDIEHLPNLKEMIGHILSRQRPLTALAVDF
jgi:hypothetical protein